MDELIELLADLPDEQVMKAVLNAAARKKLSDSDFAYIDSKGKRHLPIHDEEHVRAAMARFSQQRFESDAKKKAAAATIRAAAKRFGIAVDEKDDVAKAGSEPADATTGLFVRIEKADEINGIIYGRVNQANLIDFQDDVVRPEELRKACWGFMRYIQAEASGSPVNDTHQFGDIPGAVVECWMDGGDWMIGFQPDDIEVAKAAARGDYVGWSMEGTGNRVEVSI